jgi:hypothetical protein
MNKQYLIRIYRDTDDYPVRATFLYHDGELYKTIEHRDLVPCYCPDHSEYIEKLEENGYTQGFLPEEIQLAKELYEHRLNNIIEVKGEEKQ